MKNLFIYGTLKRGHRRAAVLAGQQFLGEARAAARYRLYDVGGYPALVEDRQGREIEGELWCVDEACLARLDDIEGVPQLYRRLPVELTELSLAESVALDGAESDASQLDVETYLYQRSVEGLADCGSCWK